MLSFDSNGLCVSAGELRHFIKKQKKIFQVLGFDTRPELIDFSILNKRLQWMEENIFKNKKARRE